MTGVTHQPNPYRVLRHSAALCILRSLGNGPGTSGPMDGPVFVSQPHCREGGGAGILQGWSGDQPSRLFQQETAFAP
jgi:hypothetical protein